MVTLKTQKNLDKFGLYLQKVYAGTRTYSGDTLHYLGMTFALIVIGKLGVAMLSAWTRGRYSVRVRDVNHEGIAWCSCPRYSATIMDGNRKQELIIV